MSAPTTRRRIPRGLALLVGLTLVNLVGFAIAATIVWSPDDQQTPQRPRAQGLNGSKLPAGLDRSQAPAFRLTDGRGGDVDTRTLRGKPYALTFLFTECPDVCPAIGQQVRIAFEQLGQDADRVAAVAISVDPEGDTPEKVRAFADRQRLPRNFQYAIGTTRQLEPVWNDYFVQADMTGRAETSTHTASVWLVDGRGRLRTRYAGGQLIDPEQLAGDFRFLLAELDGGR